MINKKWIYHEPIDPETRFHAVFSLISVIHTKNKVLEIVIDGGVNAGWISHAPSSIINYSSIDLMFLFLHIVGLVYDYID